MKDYIIPLVITVGVGLIILSYFVPFGVHDEECYNDIAVKFCNDLNSSGSLYRTFDYYYIKCCNYSNMYVNGRLLANSHPFCTNYQFTESEEDKCTKKYKYWRRVT